MGNGGRKQNILIVHNYYQIPGGEDTVVANEKKMLEDHGHKVILYSRSNDELKTMSAVRKLGLPFATIFNPRTYIEIKRLIKKEHIEIVHVHNTLNLVSPSVYYAALNCGVPVVQTVHNFRLLCPGAAFYRDGQICEDCVEKGMLCAVKHGCYRGSRLQTLICVLSAKIHRWTGVYGKINYICLTEFNKEKLLLLNRPGKNVIDPERVFVKPNFVKSIGGSVPEELRENQFVFAGRLDKLKGVDILLEAWKRMGASAPRLIVCGTGPLEDWCDEFVAKNHINVELRGFVSNEEVRRIIAGSKALVLPTQWYEGFPMSIVEAFSVGTPVIGSNMGNVGNLIVDGINGWTFEFDSPENLAHVVKMADERNQRVDASRIREYSEEENYKLLCWIYSASVCKFR